MPPDKMSCTWSRLHFLEANCEVFAARDEARQLLAGSFEGAHIEEEANEFVALDKPEDLTFPPDAAPAWVLPDDLPALIQNKARKRHT